MQIRADRPNICKAWSDSKYLMREVVRKPALRGHLGGLGRLVKCFHEHNCCTRLHYAFRAFGTGIPTIHFWEQPGPYVYASRVH